MRGASGDGEKDTERDDGDGLGCNRDHELENRTRNTIRVNGTDATFPQLSTPTELQARALALINERVPQLT